MEIVVETSVVYPPLKKSPELVTFGTSILKYYICVVKRYANFQVLAPLTPLHPIIIVGPFGKSAIVYMECRPTSV